MFINGSTIIVRLNSILFTNYGYTYLYLVGSFNLSCKANLSSTPLLWFNSLNHYFKISSCLFYLFNTELIQHNLMLLLKFCSFIDK